MQWLLSDTGNSRFKVIIVSTNVSVVTVAIGVVIFMLVIIVVKCKTITVQAKPEEDYVNIGHYSSPPIIDTEVNVAYRCPQVHSAVL